jgi:hypothetical protein
MALTWCNLVPQHLAASQKGPSWKTLDDRVTKLEREMKDVRRDAVETRLLAAGASEEVGHLRLELRAHTKTLEALRETQLDQSHEMRAGFASVDRRFVKLETEMRDGFADVGKRFVKLKTEMRDGFGKMSLGMAQITALLNIAIKQDSGD